MNLVERFNIDREELDSPNHTGIVDIHMLADILGERDINHFRAAMMKVFSNRSEDLNDFEIFEMAHAFINYIGLTPEQKVRIAMLLSPINPSHGTHTGPHPEIETEAEELQQELDALEAEIGEVPVEDKLSK